VGLHLIGLQGDRVRAETAQSKGDMVLPIVDPIMSTEQCHIYIEF